MLQKANVYRYLFENNFWAEVSLNIHKLVVDTTEEAKIDLTASVRGEFSPEDLKALLERARSNLESRLRELSAPTPDQAKSEWQEVVRSFYAENYWGYQPLTAQKAKEIKKEATTHHRLGIRFIWITFFSMCITKVIILVLGQQYVRSEESSDFWFLMLAIFLIVANFGYFLWSARNYKD